MKHYFLIVLAVSILLSSCGKAATPVALLAAPNTATPPSATSTLAPTSTPIPLPTATSTPVPISATNLAKLNEEFRIGKGTVSDAFWTQDNHVDVLYASGLTEYDLNGKAIQSVEPENGATSSDSTMSPDGKYVASLVDNTSLLIWDASSGKIQEQIQVNCNAVPESPTHKVAFSPDGQQIAVCDAKGVSVWDIASSKKVTDLSIKNDFPSDILFSSISGLLIVASSRNPLCNAPGTGDLEIMDLASGKDLATFKFPQGCNEIPIALNQAGDELAWAAGANQVQLYDLRKRNSLGTLSVSSKGISPTGMDGLGFSHDNKTLVIGGWWRNGDSFADGTLLVDIASGNVVAQTGLLASEAVKFSPDGKYVVIAGGYVSIYTADSLQQVAGLDLFLSYSTLAFDPTGRYLAIGEYLTFWDLQNKTTILQDVHGAGGWYFAFLPDGSGFVVNNGTGMDWFRKFAVYNMSGGHVDLENFIDSSSNVFVFPPKISPSGQYVAVNIGNQTIKIVSLSSYSVVSTLKGFLLSFEFSPDGKYIATGGYGVTLWDPASGKKLVTGGSDPVSDTAFSPDSTLVAGCAFSNGIMVWNIAKNQLAHEFKPKDGCEHVAFSPDGSAVASLTYDNSEHALLSVWDLATNKMRFSLTGTKTFTSPWQDQDAHAEFAFSPDGSMLVVKGFDNYLDFIDATTGQTIKTLDTFQVDFVNQDDAASFGFSADGKRFAAAGADGIIRIFVVQP